MIFLIFHNTGVAPHRAHIAEGKTLDEVLFAGNYRTLCGVQASGKRNWTVQESLLPPRGSEWCKWCVRKANPD